MILLNNENIALLEGDIVLTENDARLPSLIFPMYNTSNSKLLDVPPPVPFVPNAWKWDEATQTWLEHDSAAIEVVRNPPPPPVVIPQSITPRQIRLQLTAMGLRQQVEDLVATQPLATKDWWEFSLSYERNNQMLVDTATRFGLTSEQLDQLFIEASKL